MGCALHLSETQIGSIQGAGLYPQALSMILFSLFIDRVGYGRAMACAFAASCISCIIQ
jgi:MFS family permease